MYPACASTASPAISTPSINWCGSFSISTLSLQVPGSLSSAFTTMYFGLADIRGTKLHFIPAGNPAPPRPRRLDAFISSMISSGFMPAALRNAWYPSVARYVSIDAEFGIPKRRVSTFVSSGLGSLYSIALWLLPQAVQKLVQLLRRYKMVKIVIHLHGRRPRARPHALHFFDRDLAVRRHFLVPDSQFLAGVFVELVAVVQQATDIRAHLHVEFPQRLAVQHRVIREDFVHLQRAHAHAPGHFLDQFVGNMPQLILRVTQHRNHRRPLPPRRVACQKLREPRFELWRKSHLPRPTGRYPPAQNPCCR